LGITIKNVPIRIAQGATNGFVIADAKVADSLKKELLAGLNLPGPSSNSWSGAHLLWSLKSVSQAKTKALLMFLCPRICMTERCLEREDFGINREIETVTMLCDYCSNENYF